MKMVEDKITYLEGQDRRVVRGMIIDEKNGFIFLQRRDGVIEINRNIVEKIERAGRGDNSLG